MAELDALVEEVLLASRLDASEAVDRRERVDLLGLTAEEAARVDAEVDGPALQVQGDERCCAVPCATCWRTHAATAAAR